MKENVCGCVRVSRNQVGRVALEHDELTVTRNGRASSALISLHSRAAHAYPRRGCGRDVVDENVSRIVVVAGDEVVRRARHEHGLPVVRNPQRKRGLVGLHSRRGDADPQEEARGSVEPKCIELNVVVGNDQVGRAARKDDDLPVRGHRAGQRLRIAPSTRRGVGDDARLACLGVGPWTQSEAARRKKPRLTCQSPHPRPQSRPTDRRAPKQHRNG
jgi:hypothetical protein